MRLHAPRTFITDPLFNIPQKEKIAPNIAAKIVCVNGPLIILYKNSSSECKQLAFTCIYIMH